MGLTAVGIIYWPWGMRSGAHLNPTVTLTFWRLGKVARWDAVFYVVAQFAGGVGGVLLAARVLGRALAAQVYVWRHGSQHVVCAKLHHQNTKRCIFAHCGYEQRQAKV